MLLKKPSKTLTVNVEYDYRSTSEDFKKPNSIDLEVLSTQLRKANCGSIWTADLEALAIFARQGCLRADDNLCGNAGLRVIRSVSLETQTV